MDAAKSALAAAQEHAGAAQSDNQRVQALHNYTNVTAPLDGVVIWRYADTGAPIRAVPTPMIRHFQSFAFRRAIFSACAFRYPRTM